MLTDQEIQANQRFFRDPTVGEGLLKPPATGMACTNIRTALRLLGYNIDRGEQYDEQLTTTVRQFQIDYHHTSHDGFVGPGTGQLLAQILAQKLDRRGFLHMEDPQEQLKKKLQAPLRKDIERKNELINTYKEHLHILELQAAKFGTMSAPPHVQIGINETKEMITKLYQEVADIEKLLH